MRQSTRLVVNTLATVSRMAVTVGIGLVTTRLFLRALGQSDFGLLSVLGATGAMIVLVTQALTASTQRHLAYEVGRGDRRKLAEVFSSALVLFAAAGAIVWLLGQALAPLILWGLTIPEEREAAAWWVFQFSLLGIGTTVLLTPYQGIIAAHQELVISSVVEVAVSVLRLGVVALLFVVSADRLVSYAMMNFAVQAGVMMGLVGLCLWRYPSSRPAWGRVRRAEMKRLGSYAGWSILGNLAASLRQQGGALLLNVRFGPVLNAAYAISSQVTMYTTNFSTAIARAVQPAIVSEQAKGHREQVHQLTLVMGKYALFALGVVFVPIWLDVALVLQLWLGDVPPHAIVLVRVSLAWALMQPLARGYWLAVQATGDIGWYTMTMLALVVGSLVLAGVAFWGLGWGPWALPAATVVAVLCQLAVCVVMIGRRIGLSPADWLRRCAMRLMGVMGPAAAGVALLHELMPETAWRVLTAVGVYAAISVPLVWLVGLEAWEKQHFRRIGVAILDRLQAGGVRAGHDTDDEESAT